MTDKNLYSSIGRLKLEDLEGFVSSNGWKCQHCANENFEIEQFADTGWCAVSATPYVRFKEKKDRYSECGVGYPAYTVICSRCFATTKYHAVKVAEAIQKTEKEVSDWLAPQITESS
jgi:predicted nucleic-acid-binding Zn-ribbon protein